MFNFCAMGLHRFVHRRATHRPTTIVSRCERCGETRVKHTAPRPDPGVDKPSWSRAPNVPPRAAIDDPARPIEPAGPSPDREPARRAARVR